MCVRLLKTENPPTTHRHHHYPPPHAPSLPSLSSYVGSALRPTPSSSSSCPVLRLSGITRQPSPSPPPTSFCLSAFSWVSSFLSSFFCLEFKKKNKKIKDNASSPHVSTKTALEDQQLHSTRAKHVFRFCIFFLTLFFCFFFRGTPEGKKPLTEGRMRKEKKEGRRMRRASNRRGEEDEGWKHQRKVNPFHTTTISRTTKRKRDGNNNKKKTEIFASSSDTFRSN